MRSMLCVAPILVVAGVLGSRGTECSAQPITLAPVPNLVGTTTVAAAEVPGTQTDGRLFAIELRGNLRIISRSQPGPPATPALDLTGIIPSDGDENGLLGLALHPNFRSNGYVYLFHSRINQPPVLVRYTAPLTGTGPIDPATRTPVMSFPTFSFIHISGWIGFGHDGLLYITHGDNGASANAQDATTLRGKVLRIDVDHDDFPSDPDRNYAIPQSNPLASAINNQKPEILCLGIRNAWRCSFDRLTGDLLAADVGDSSREEVTRLPSSLLSDPAPGSNLGWPCFEGNLVRSTGCSSTAFPYLAPLSDFTRQDLQCIVGGYLYRGSAIPALAGRYFFANCFTSTKLFSFDPANPSAGYATHTIGPQNFGLPLGFAEDRFGELMMLSTNGAYRIIGVGDFVAPDCDANAIPDAAELAAGLGTDLNNDSVLDICTRLCPPDVNGDRAVSVQDIFDFLAIWFRGIPAADFNEDAAVSVQDIFDFLAGWFAGCA